MPINRISHSLPFLEPLNGKLSGSMGLHAPQARMQGQVTELQRLVGGAQNSAQATDISMHRHHYTAFSCPGSQSGAGSTAQLDVADSRSAAAMTDPNFQSGCVSCRQLCTPGRDGLLVGRGWFQADSLRPAGGRTALSRLRYKTPGAGLQSAGGTKTSANSQTGERTPSLESN